MALWCVKGGHSGEFEQRMLENSVIAMGWRDMADLSQFNTREKLESYYREVYRDQVEGRVKNHVAQLWAFSHRMKVGDLVVLPLKTQAAIAIGEITSDYEYSTEVGDDIPHQRKVSWVQTDLPRTSFDQDLLYSFGAFLTVCQVRRNKAEERVQGIIEGKPKRAIPGVEPETLSSDSEIQDVERAAKDQILEFVSRRFRGHELARLVEAVLQAQGYFTERSGEGPDGGVDILAAAGEMGFDTPRICVQVKSSDNAVGVEVFRALVGTMQSVGADQGLLASWGGFRSSVLKEARSAFFNVRLWNQDDLIEAIFATYDNLPDTIQAELSLKRIWALAIEEQD